MYPVFKWMQPTWNLCIRERSLHFHPFKTRDLAPTPLPSFLLISANDHFFQRCLWYFFLSRIGWVPCLLLIQTVAIKYKCYSALLFEMRFAPFKPRVLILARSLHWFLLPQGSREWLIQGTTMTNQCGLKSLWLYFHLKCTELMPCIWKELNAI